jgi:hypothetical protein
LFVAAMSCADFCGRIDGAKRQSMTSVSEVTAEEGREKFLCTQPESSRQPLAYETRMVPQDHCQCMQITRLDMVQGLGNVKTETIVMEVLRQQALHWALLLQDEDPDAAADWKLLKPLMIERFDKAVNKTHKFKLIAALQQRQHKNAKDFLDRCKTAWYGLLRKIRATYATDAERAAHDGTRNKCIKCMFICGMHNYVRLAVEQIAGNTDTLKTALVDAVQYKSAINTGVVKQGQAQRYGVAALEITGSSSAASSAPQSAPGPAGMHEMKQELAAISTALAALGVQKESGKPKPPGGQTRGPRKQAPAGVAGG